MSRASQQLLVKLKTELPPVFFTNDVTPLLREFYESPGKKLLQLTKQGDVIRIKRGVYCFDSHCDRFLIAGALHSPSYISYESALSYYGMIPERVEGQYSVVQGRPNDISTIFGEYIYRSQSVELYALGMNMIFIDDYPVLIATKEKAVLDTLAQHSLSASSMSPECVFEYVVENLRIEPSRVLSLSSKKLKKLVGHYRNHAPRKLYTYINSLSREHPDE